MRSGAELDGAGIARAIGVLVDLEVRALGRVHVARAGRAGELERGRGVRRRGLGLRVDGEGHEPRHECGGNRERDDARMGVRGFASVGLVARSGGAHVRRFVVLGLLTLPCCHGSLPPTPPSSSASASLEVAHFAECHKT